ncbi:uncharacterized protein LOC117632069 isoform X1 [Prunus dulcis]|uniref:uncharacterized protein LOC117632069 isoform X1 n=1 Tax=Prunus dulcis TaxID=3755 RepID=UPI0014826432|nr:uncharacterized protein LOC117632069 isoform X1 [Prunus dulcis]
MCSEDQDQDYLREQTKQCVQRVRRIFEKAFNYFRTSASELKEERCLLLEEMLNVEAGFGDLGDVSLVQSKLPKKLKKRRPIVTEEGPAGYEEYIDYSFPEEAHTQNLKILETAYMWKKRKQLKRKSDAADYEAESSDRSAAPGPGYTEVVTSPLQTPVSSKVGKANKTSRLTKCSRSGPQTPACNVGSPSGANLTPAGPCRFDSSLGLLTKKFNNLIKHAEDGILDLNNAADTLEAQIENLSDEEHRLDQQIREMQE